jgi:hypothetical protein
VFVSKFLFFLLRNCLECVCGRMSCIVTEMPLDITPLGLYGRGICQLTDLCTSPMIPWSIFSPGTCTGHPKIDKPPINRLSELCAAFVRPLCGRTEQVSFRFRPLIDTCGRTLHPCVRIFLQNSSERSCGRTLPSVRPHWTQISSNVFSKCSVRALCGLVGRTKCVLSSNPEISTRLAQ